MKCFFQAKLGDTRGYTLIELLVVIGIVAVITGGAIAGYMRFSNRQQVRMYAQEVQQIFRLAKSKAQVHETPAECDGNPVTEPALTGYRVIVTDDGKNVRMQPICEGNSLKSDYKLYPFVSLPSGISISPINDYNYYTLNGGASYGNESSFTNRTIEITDGTTTYQFTINSGGAISGVDEP